jgi:hypothetical protein
VGSLGIPIKSFSSDSDTGCISSFETVRGLIYLDGWGCEFGNWRGFFSQQRMNGLGAELVSKQIVQTRDQIRTKLEVLLPHGHFEFNGTDSLVSGAILRTYALTALRKSALGDFVVRTAVHGNDWPLASLGNKVVRHRKRNRMLERKEPEVLLSSEGLVLSIKVDYIRCHESMDFVTYVRDEPPHLWVIHQRLLARNGECDEYVLRVRRHVVSDGQWPIVGNKYVRTALWRISEHFWGILPTFQIGGNVFMEAGTKLEFLTTVRVRALKD